MTLNCPLGVLKGLFEHILGESSLPSLDSTELIHIELLHNKF